MSDFFNQLKSGSNSPDFFSTIRKKTKYEPIKPDTNKIVWPTTKNIGAEKFNPDDIQIKRSGTDVYGFNLKGLFSEGEKEGYKGNYDGPKNEKGEPIDEEYFYLKAKKYKDNGQALYKNLDDEQLKAQAKKEFESNKAANDKYNRAKEVVTSNDSALGDESYKKWLYINGEEDTAINKAKFYAETPYRIKGVSNIIDRATESMGGGTNQDSVSKLYEDKRSTGNKVLDAATGFGGNALSMFMPIPGTGNVTPTNIADDFAANVANKYGKGPITKSIIKGGVSGGVDGAVDTVRDVTNENSLAENVFYGALGGGALFSAGSGLKQGGKKLMDKAFDSKFGDTSMNFDGLGKGFDIKRSDGLTPKGMYSKGVEEVPKVTIKKEKVSNDIGVYKNRGLEFRNIDNLKSITNSSKTNAISYDYPDLQKDLQTAAEGLKNEMKFGIKGESQNVWEDGNFVGNVKTPKIQSETIHELQQKGMSYDDIEKGIDDIIKDHGAENSTEAKKVELHLDRDLTQGTKSVEGYDIPPNNDYLEKKQIISQLEGDISKGGFNNTKVYSGTEKIPTSKKVGLNQIKGLDKFDNVPDKTVPMEMDFKPTERQPIVNTGAETVFEESKQKWNTWKNADFMQDEATQKMVDDINAFYEVKPNAQSHEIALNELNSDFEGVVNRLKTNGIKTAEDSVASGLITNKLVQEAKASGDYTKVNEWLKIVRPQITDIAQSLQAFSTWKNLSPEGALLKAQRVVDSAKENLLKDPKVAREVKANPDKVDEVLKKHGFKDLSKEDSKLIAETMEKINNMPDGREKDIEFGKVKNLIGNKAIPGFADKFKALQRISMLLNTKTMTRNVVGNVIMGGLENIKDLPGAAIDKGLSKFTGSRTTQAPSIKGLGTQIDGMKTGVKNTLEDYKLGIDTSPSRGQYEIPDTKAFKGNGLLSKAEDLTNLGLKLGDSPFYQAAYEDSLRQLKELNGGQITDEMEQLAHTIAKDRTFQNESLISKGLQGIQKGLNLNKDVGLGTVALPFVKTPSNILDKAIDYSPVGLAKGGYNLFKNRGLDMDLATQKKIVDQLARGTIGTGLIGAGYLGAESGLLNGSGPDDLEALQLEKQAGKLPYSVNVGDSNYTIDNLQPAAIPLMIGADMQKAVKNSKPGASAAIDGIKSGFGTLANQSLLTGLSKLFGGYEKTPGDNITQGAINTAIGIPQQFVPSALKQATQLIDPNVRDTSSTNPLGAELNKIKSKIPGLSFSLPQKYDTMGEPMKINNGATGIENIFDTLFNPGYDSNYQPTKAEELALNIYDETGDTKQMPRLAKNYIDYKDLSGKKQRVQLTGEEKQELQKLIGERTNSAYSSFSQRGSRGDQANELQKILTNIYQQAEDEILNKKGISYKKK